MTTKYTLNDIRKSYLDFFKEHGHSLLPSSSLVPQNDPTLMFTNAGMVQFKNTFSGAEILRDSSGKIIKRATTSQKCVRAGGKHNDLENVGYTARHHTFFEMLGNFSFGDYFKEEAISYAWEYLTKTLGLPKEKLIVTVYHNDDVAFDLWKKIAGFSDDKIIRIASSDNFWAMGATGPCGPCSEIFYDHGEDIFGGPPGSPDEEGDRFVEIWNLVFTQYDKQAPKDGEKDGEFLDLPHPCIDTGMGLERMVAIIQGKHNNYDIDLFENLIAALHKELGNPEGDTTASHKVIADHLRSCSFLMADGVMPSNEGRGYVLRRIMRRGMRHIHMLGSKKSLMYKLVPALIDEMGHIYPELVRAEALITETMRLEEERFRETLGRGLKLLDGELDGLKSGDSLSGEVAFKLYDTYGFPLDLTEDILRGKNLSIEKNGFETAMEEQKKRARAAWSGSGGEAATEEIWFDIKEEFGATEFLGYTLEEASGEIVAIVKDGERTSSIKAGEKAAVLVNQTPFYGESGGQAGDRGEMIFDSGKLAVLDTKKRVGSLHVHHVLVENGEVSLGEIIELKVDKTRKNTLCGNHSVTHLLHAALRKNLGDHVTQKGSLVEGEYFRFDFSHSARVTDDELQKIEEEVNALIAQNTEVVTHLMSPEEATKQGAMALFGEKYGDEVRVVSMGKSGSSDYSVELCGGTHVRRTGDIGGFRITKETAVASGIRRIEGVTGNYAIAYTLNQQKILSEISECLKVAPEEAFSRIAALRDERKKLEREVSELKKKLAMTGGGSGEKKSTKPEKIGDIYFLSRSLEGVPAKELRGLVDDMKKKITSGVIVLISDNDGKAAIVVGVTDDLVDKISAVDLVRKGSEILGGKGGGGRPNFAQAGGSDAGKAGEAIEVIKNYLATI